MTRDTRAQGDPSTERTIPSSAPQREAKAMDHFEALLRTHPESVAAREGETKAAEAWAADLATQGRGTEAMSVLERALALLPQNPELLVSFGLEAISLGQFPIAAEALQTADRLHPNDAKTIYAIARLEVEEQKLAEATRDLKRYLALRPEDASAYFGLGHVYAMEQQYGEARRAFQRCIQLEPVQTESYYQLGELDLQDHADAAAKQEFEKVLVRDPKHAGALTGMGEIALRNKDFVKAEQYLRAAEESDPAYPTPHYFRGLALARLGRKDEAMKEMQMGDSRPHAVAPDTQSTGTSTSPSN